MKATFQDMRSALTAQRMKVDFDTYDLTCDELTRRIINGRIDVAPVYQRQFRWNSERQSGLIESVLLGIPIPNLFMATTTNPNQSAVWEVVDGLQRSLSIASFILKEEDLKNIGLRRPLRLKGLDKLPELNGCLFDDLPEDIRSAFTDRPIKVTVLNDKSDRQVRFDLFERLNSGGISLTPQEMRACVYRGPFLKLVDDLSSLDDFHQVAVIPKSRQSDGTPQEYVLRFFAYLHNANEFKHSVNDFLNEYLHEANEGAKLFFDECKSEFVRVMKYLAACFPNGIRRNGKGSTPANVFEGVSVGAALALAENPNIAICQDCSWIDSDEFRGYTLSATNSLPKVLGRIDYAKRAFLTNGCPES